MATDTKNEQEKSLDVKIRTVSDTCQYKSNEYVTVSYDEFMGDTLFVSNNCFKMRGGQFDILDCFLCRLLSADCDEVLFAFKIPNVDRIYSSSFSYATSLCFKIGTTVYETKPYRHDMLDRRRAAYYKINEEVLKALCDAPNVRMQLRKVDDMQPQLLEDSNCKLMESARMFYNGAYQMDAYTITKNTIPKKTKR